MTRLVLATGNPGKVREFDDLLADTPFEIVPQSELNVTEAPETGLTFVENAILKARNATTQTRLPALADDSGIEVDALHGEPGVHSARYAGPSRGMEDNVEKLLRELGGVQTLERTARFRCVLVLLSHAKDPAPLICEGVWEGRVLESPKGAGGFGYDPVFWVPERNRSAAELEPAEKNRLSHRAKALAALRRALDKDPAARIR
jgi:XTP/dITP diphosphohydrolase